MANLPPVPPAGGPPFPPPYVRPAKVSLVKSSIDYKTIMNHFDVGKNVNILLSAIDRTCPIMCRMTLTKDGNGRITVHQYKHAQLQRLFIKWKSIQSGVGEVSRTLETAPQLKIRLISTVGFGVNVVIGVLAKYPFIADDKGLIPSDPDDPICKLFKLFQDEAKKHDWDNVRNLFIDQIVNRFVKTLVALRKEKSQYRSAVEQFSRDQADIFMKSVAIEILNPSEKMTMRGFFITCMSLFERGLGSKISDTDLSDFSKHLVLEDKTIAEEMKRKRRSTLGTIGYIAGWIQQCIKLDKGARWRSIADNNERPDEANKPAFLDKITRLDRMQGKSGLNKPSDALFFYIMTAELFYERCLNKENLLVFGSNILKHALEEITKCPYALRKCRDFMMIGELGVVDAAKVFTDVEVAILHCHLMLCFVHMKGPDYIRRLLSKKKRKELGSNATHRIQVQGGSVKQEKGDTNLKDIARGVETSDMEVDEEEEESKISDAAGDDGEEDDDGEDDAEADEEQDYEEDEEEDDKKNYDNGNMMKLASQTTNTNFTFKFVIANFE